MDIYDEYNQDERTTWAFDDENDDWMSPEERFEDNLIRHREYRRVKDVYDKAVSEGRHMTWAELFPDLLEPYGSVDFWESLEMPLTDWYSEHSTPPYKRNKHKYGKG